MLAMAVFAIAGIALLGAAENNFRNLAHLEQKMFAGWIASNRLVEVNVDKSTWPPKNNKKGKVEMLDRDWFWQQKVLKTTDDNMRAVIIEVRLDEKEALPLTTLMTYVSKEVP